MKHLKNQKGFTLMELMIVVAIIIVLIAIAGTTWILSLNHLSLRNDAGSIKDALIKAKSLAINTGRNHQVYFDIINEVYQIEDCNLDSTGVIAPDGNNCNIPAAVYFSGSGATHGTVVGSLRDIRTASFGHKPINLATMLDGGGAAVNMVRFNADGTATFFNSAVRSDSTTLDIALARTDGNAETKTVEINSNGRVKVP